MTEPALTDAEVAALRRLAGDALPPGWYRDQFGQPMRVTVGRTPEPPRRSDPESMWLQVHEGEHGCAWCGLSAPGRTTQPVGRSRPSPWPSDRLWSLCSRCADTDLRRADIEAAIAGALDLTGRDRRALPEPRALEAALVASGRTWSAIVGSPQERAKAPWSQINRVCAEVVLATVERLAAERAERAAASAPWTCSSCHNSYARSHPAVKNRRGERCGVCVDAGENMREQRVASLQAERAAAVQRGS
jgi:hypothetical protein